MPLIYTKNVEEATRYIHDGRVVAFPTGTSYGLAVDALQGHALQRLRNIKKRPAEKTFTIFLDPELWGTYLNMSDQERQLLNRYAHTALTVLVQPKDSLEHLAQDGYVGLRVIDHPLMADLARSAQVPLTATSANISGQDACYDTACITESFPRKVGTTYDLSLAAILDGGPLRPGLISTIVKLNNGTIEVIRQGALVLS